MSWILFDIFNANVVQHCVYRNSKEVISRRIASNCCRFLLGYQWVHFKHIRETQETTCHVMFISLTSAYILLHMRACSYQYA